MELGLVNHVSLQGWQKDLRGVAEHNDSQCDWKWEDVYAHGDLGLTPSVNVQTTVAEDDGVDHHVNDTIVKTEAADGLQIFQKGARQEEEARGHHVRPRVDNSPRKRAHHQITAQNDVEDASHE